MRLLLIPALAVCLGAPGLCAAQIFSGAGAAPVLAMPDAEGAPRPPAVDPSQAEPALRRLPSVASSLRLWGENGEIVWPFYATEAEARLGGRFRIGYLAAVSVLPEASSLTLSVNGTIVGSVAIDGARGLRQVAFDLPAGLLARGFNAVRIGVAQRHRVDCSLPASYELWTQIDPASTGLMARPGASPAGIADIAAAAPAADGAVPMRLVQTGERLSERGAERLIGMAQEAALAGRFGQVSAVFAREPGAGEGLALALGTAAELAPVLDLAALGRIEGPRLALLAGQRRPVLVATGADEAQVDEALAELSRLRRGAPTGHPAGLAALSAARGRTVEGGERLSLADLGFADAHIRGRSHRLAFDLDLPHDLLAADYDRLVLDLDANAPAGLEPGARIGVEINGASAGSTPLPRKAGMRAERRSIFLPLRLLRPGRNRVAIAVELPGRDETLCPASQTTQPERLILRASSRLTIPPLARIARQPDLAGTFAAGFPYAGAAAERLRRPTLSVPAPSPDAMAAAATLAAELALAAGRPIPFALAAGRAEIAGPSLVVAPAPRLDAALVGAAGLDPAALREAWTGRETLAAAAEPSPFARRIALRRDAVASCRAGAPPAAGRDGAEEGGADLGGASAILAQAVTGPAADDILTLVSAPSAGALREAVECLAHPRIWPRIRGRLAALSAADGAVVVREPEAPRHVATAPASLANLRRIAAGWLSLHAGLYGLFAFLVAGGLAGSTHLLVRQLGRRP